MVTSDFRPEVEVWPFRACALKIRNISLVVGTIGRCAVAMRQMSRSTKCASSSMKYQLKAPSNNRNFAIYKEIGVKESNADMGLFLLEPHK